MTKKDKKPKVTTVVTKNGESVKVFEDVAEFETFLRQEVEDDGSDLDNLHCQIRYYPPFVLHESHEDPEKIKDSANSHSKKFVRHLHQHVEKHLLRDISSALGSPDMKFKTKSKVETFDSIVWSYSDEAHHEGSKPYHVDIVVSCKHDDAMVDVDYKMHPLESAI